MPCRLTECCLQALNFWGVLEELDLGKTVPDLKGLGYSMLGSNDSLVFTSNSWNITLDPHSGAVHMDVMLQAQVGLTLDVLLFHSLKTSRDCRRGYKHVHDDSTSRCALCAVSKASETNYVGQK